MRRPRIGETKVLLLIAAAVGVAVVSGVVASKSPGGFGGMPDPAYTKCKAQAAKDPRATALLGGEAKFVTACLHVKRVTGTR